MTTDVAITAVELADSFLEILPELNPDFKFIVDPNYVAGIILQLISSEGMDYVNDDSFLDKVIEILEDRCKTTRENLLNRSVDIISETSDDIIDAMSALDDNEVRLILDRAITRGVNDNESQIYDTSGFGIVSYYIEPYLRMELTESAEEKYV
jgi:hypothetical protein